MKLKTIKLSDYKDHPKNPNTHPDGQVGELVSSLDQFSQVKNIVIWKGFYLAGHGMARAAREKGLKTLKAVDVSDWTESKAVAFMVADNRLPELSIMDDGALKDILDGFEDPLSIPGVDDDFFEALGFNDPETEAVIGGLGTTHALKTVGGDTQGSNSRKRRALSYQGGEKGSLAREFIVPPFSILDTRQALWLDRKRNWEMLGYDGRATRGHIQTLPNLKGDRTDEATVSVFNPVLCEIMFRWFCGSGGRIIDPFSGGSVAGIISAQMGFKFVGIDLRDAQVQANRTQWEEVQLLDRKMGGSNDLHGTAEWFVGDSLNLGGLVSGKFDFLYSCPPYADLEVYSDDARDISYMEYEAFLKSYYTIIDRCLSKLNKNRFACFVVGDVRDKKGFYRGFIGETITAFRRSGAMLWNEAILINSYSSVPLRARKPFVGSRKLAKTHQNVLVFCKGDPHKATEWIERTNAAAGLAVGVGAEVGAGTADEIDGSSLE